MNILHTMTGLKNCTKIFKIFITLIDSLCKPHYLSNKYTGQAGKNQTGLTFYVQDDIIIYLNNLINHMIYRTYVPRLDLVECLKYDSIMSSCGIL